MYLITWSQNRTHWHKELLLLRLRLYSSNFRLYAFLCTCVGNVEWGTGVVSGGDENWSVPQQDSSSDQSVTWNKQHYAYFPRRHYYSWHWEDWIVRQLLSCSCYVVKGCLVHWGFISSCSFPVTIHSSQTLPPDKETDLPVLGFVYTLAFKSAFR